EDRAVPAGGHADDEGVVDGAAGASGDGHSVLRSLDDDVYLGAPEAMHGVVRADADAVDGGRERQALERARHGLLLDVRMLEDARAEHVAVGSEDLVAVGVVLPALVGMADR